MNFESLFRFPKSYNIENDFKLVFKNNVMLSYPRFKICCISPFVDNLLSNDQSIRSVFIEYEICSECVNKLNNIMNGETIDESETNDIYPILDVLGHNEFHNKVGIENENIFHFLKNYHL